MAALYVVGLGTANAQQTYWAGKYRRVEKTTDCNSSELLITIGFTVACVTLQSLAEDKEIGKRFGDADSRIKFLENEIKSLAAANDALTKRIDELERPKAAASK